MASTHKSLRSGTANKRPTTSIADGQIALNTNVASPGLYFKDSTGASIIKIGPVHVGTTAPNVAPAGSSGNSTGEAWLDTSLTPNGWKVWTGAAWTNATPVGSDTVQGLLELATNAETQAGSDTARAVTPAGLQSKVSDSTSTTSSTTIASSTAVKSAYDLANAALPKSGGTVTGNLEIGTSGSLTFEGATADAFETTLAVVDPTADRTITFPDTTGTVVTTGDTGTVTSAMIANSTIVDADISASAEIAVSKLADGAARQLLQTDAAGTGVEWTTNVDVPGTLDVTGTTTLDSTLSIPLGSAASPTVFFTGDSNTGIYSPGADQVAISTGGTGRVFVASDGKVGIGAAPSYALDITGDQRITNSAGNTLTINRTANPGSIAWQHAGTETGQIQAISGGGLNFYTGSTPTLRATLDSSGRLGVGTSVPNYQLHATTSFAVGAAGFNQQLSFTNDTIQSLILGSGYTALKLNPLGGNVGIGTSAPAQKLEIQDGSISIGSSSNVNTTNVLVAGYGYILSGTKYGNTSIRSTYSNSNNAASLEFYVASVSTSTAEAMRIDSAGNVGIGTTSPGTRLEVSGADGEFIRINTTTSAGGYMSFRTNTVNMGFIGAGDQLGGGTATDLNVRSQNSLTFCTNGGNERARIDSSGRLLVGTSTTSATSTAVFASRSDAAAAPLVALHTTESTVTNGANFGTLSFGNTASSGTNAGAFIQAQRDGGTWTNNSSMPGRLVFSTTADAASSPTERMRITSAGLVGIGTTSPGSYNSAADNLVVADSGSGGITIATGTSNYGSIYFADGTSGADQYRGVLEYNHSNNAMAFFTDGSERFRCDSSGRLLVGTSSGRAVGFSSLQAPVQVETTTAAAYTAVNNTNDANGCYVSIAKTRGTSAGAVTAVQNNDELGAIRISGSDGTGFVVGAQIIAAVDGTPGTNDLPTRLVFSTTADGASSPTERMRIQANGNVLFGTTTENPGIANTVVGSSVNQGYASFSRNDNPLYVSRTASDGTLVQFFESGTQEGNISVSGTTVSYNGAHLSRWSQLPSGNERTEILRGSVLSNIDEMCEWEDEENEQLNRMKVSDIEGDKNVSGVFQAWDDDDDTYTNDFYCAMTGDFIIRIAAGTIVERGDLLMSAGDGTAKPQDDDIIRSKTIAKVTSTNVSCTYDDGSYCVPCVLMAC